MSVRARYFAVVILSYVLVISLPVLSSRFSPKVYFLFPLLFVFGWYLQHVKCPDCGNRIGRAGLWRWHVWVPANCRNCGADLTDH